MLQHIMRGIKQGGLKMFTGLLGLGAGYLIKKSIEKNQNEPYEQYSNVQNAQISLIINTTILRRECGESRF